MQSRLEVPVSSATAYGVNFGRLLLANKTWKETKKTHILILFCPKKMKKKRNLLGLLEMLPALPPPGPGPPLIPHPQIKYACGELWMSHCLAESPTGKHLGRFLPNFPEERPRI